MRKSDMTDRQLQERSTIVQTLMASGWQDNIGDRFDKQVWFYSEAHLSCHNEHGMNLQLKYTADGSVVKLKIHGPGGKGIDLAVPFNDKLQPLLNTILSFQNTVSMENYAPCALEISKVYPSACIELGDRIFPLNEENLKHVIRLMENEMNTLGPIDE